MHSILNRAVTHARPGTRSSATSSRCATSRPGRRAARPSRSPSPRPRPCSRRPKRLAAARLHRAVAAHRRPHRGTPRAAWDNVDLDGPAGRRHRRCRRRSRSCARSGPAGTRRPASPAAGCAMPAALRRGPAPRTASAAATSEGRHRWATRLVFASADGHPARRAQRPPRLPPRRRRRRAGRRRRGHHGRCGTASCRCCPTPACRSSSISRLVGHSGTAVTETVYRQQIRPVWRRAPPRWTASSRATAWRSHSDSHSRTWLRPRHRSGTGPLTCANAVGTTGFEPATP